MSKLQKSIIVIAIALMLILTYSVSAISPADIGYEGSNIESSYGADTGIYTLKLTGDAKQDLVVSNGETVVLDLGSYNFTNCTDGCATITVENGGALTIIGSGKITNTSTNEVPVIANNGTLVIDGGTVEVDRKGATGVYNYSTGNLTVSSGEIKTTASDCWGLTNFGTTVIEGGTLTQGANYSVIMNSANMNIIDGTIQVAEGNTSAYSSITNENLNSDVPVVLEISGGTVAGGIHNDTEGGDKVTITGGTFGTPDAVKEFLDSSVEFDENGNIVEAGADYTKVNEALVKVEALNEKDYTAESWKALQDEIAKINYDLKVSAQTTVDEYAEAIENAIAKLEKVAVENEGEETIPSDTTETETTVPENNEETKNEVEDNVTENPTTGDSIVVFGVIFAVAVAGLTVTLIVKKRMK